MAEQGTLVAVSVSETKGVKKHNVGRVRLKPAWGIEGDAHAGEWHRQISLLALESIQKMQAMGAKVTPGDFAENLTTQGVDVPHLHVGDHVMVGEVELEVTQIGKECHAGCAIRQQVGDCVMPREGVFARVLRGGTVKPGDPIAVLALEAGRSPVIHDPATP